jgi:hypothetical protein
MSDGFVTIDQPNTCFKATLRIGLAIALAVIQLNTLESPMADTTLLDLVEGIKANRVVPYLGAGALQGTTAVDSGEPIPADSDSLIMAMNGGKPMSPRGALTRFLDQTYGTTAWTRAPLHDWLATLKPRYIIDINRDTQLQDSYRDTPHTLIRGIARVGGTDYRFRLHHYDGEKYSEKEIDQAEVDPGLPMLFKPMGSPLPDATYIASDADYVDYLTELMGGFGIPAFVKMYRKNKQYLFLGLRLTRDTERMVLSDMIYSAGAPAGWALIPDPTAKERRFCDRQRIEIIEAGVDELLLAANFVANDNATLAAGQDVGC